MKCFVAVVVLVVNLGYSQGVVKWPSQYFIEGEKIDMIEHSVTRFKFWVDDKDHKLRFEDTASKTQIYFNWHRDFMVYNRANKDADTSVVCSKIDSVYFPVETLPVMDHFEFSGKVMHEGKRAEMWTYVENNDKYKFEETILVYRNTPIRYSYKYFNIINGNLDTHFIVNYFEFSKRVSKDEFVLDESNCKEIYDFDNNGKEISEIKEHHNLHNAFNRFKKYYNKSYNITEHNTRKEIFKYNWRMVKEHNNKNLSYKLTLNQFADQTPEEMKRINSIRPHTPGPGTHTFPYTASYLDKMELPDEFDWRLKGAVSRVKSQGNCGSCWAFATTAAIEGALSVKYKSNFDLSEQSIVDCAWAYDVYGCDGGYTERAMKYVLDHGIATEADYGDYLAMDGECHIKNMSRTYKLEGFAAVTSMSINALKAAVYYHGPVATYIQVTEKMYLYSHGIYYDFPESDPTEINHVVVVVGYGVRDGELYWIVKNSYGADWGEDGYILVAAKDNTGNILFASYYAIV